jgi:hypothetical protein
LCFDAARRKKHVREGRFEMQSQLIDPTLCLPIGNNVASHARKGGCSLAPRPQRCRPDFEPQRELRLGTVSHRFQKMPSGVTRGRGGPRHRLDRSGGLAVELRQIRYRRNHAPIVRPMPNKAATLVIGVASTIVATLAGLFAQGQ